MAMSRVRLAWSRSRRRSSGIKVQGVFPILLLLLSSEESTDRDEVHVWSVRSALGETYAATPMVLPVRSHLDGIRRLLGGELLY